MASRDQPLVANSQNPKRESGADVAPETRSASASVSVVIPCYRCGSTIARAVDSVLGQTLQPQEVILVDDHSSDGTLGALISMAASATIPMKVLALDVNSGPGAARNAGWAAATGDWVAFLDSDDSWHPQKLERVLRVIGKQPSVDLVGHLTAMFRSSEVGRSDFGGSVHTRGVQKWRILLGNVVSTPAVVLRRSLPERFPDRRYAEDYELWLRLVLRGRCVIMIDEELAFIHKRDWGAGGLSADLWKMELGEHFMYKTLQNDGLLSMPMKNLLGVWSFIKYVRRLLLRPFRTCE